MQRLTSDRKIEYTVAFSILAATLIALLITPKYVRWGAAVVLAASAAVAYTALKKRRILSFNKRQVLMITSVFAALYLMLYYLSSAFYGLTEKYLGLSVSSFFGIVLPILIIIGATEVIRGVLISQENRALCVCAYFIGLLSELLIAGGVLGISSSYALVDLIAVSLFPAVTANLMFNYLSRRYGIMPNTVYRAILSVYMYVIPVVPSTPAVFSALALLLLPLPLYFFVDILFEKKKKSVTAKKSRYGFIFPSIIIALAVGVIMLISCQFRYGILVVGSPSMSGEINTGDAVVYERYEVGDAELGDVIVFTKNGGTKIIHRLVDVYPVDGQNRYVTKGDANKDNDNGYITDADISGVVKFKIAYIGYPSLWLRDIFAK